jgi:hypothetical protein
VNEPKNFQELVSWACWEVIQGFTQGQTLRSVMHGVLMYVRQWKPEEPK